MSCSRWRGKTGSTEEPGKIALENLDQIVEPNPENHAQHTPLILAGENQINNLGFDEARSHSSEDFPFTGSLHHENKISDGRGQTKALEMNPGLFEVADAGVDQFAGGAAGSRKRNLLSQPEQTSLTARSGQLPGRSGSDNSSADNDNIVQALGIGFEEIHDVLAGSK